MARDLQRKHETTYFGTGGSSPLTNEYGRGDIDADTAKPGLQVEITVDDPTVFTAPWSGLASISTERESPNGWVAYDCLPDSFDSRIQFSV
jgi:hypothetical protein